MLGGRRHRAAPLWVFVASLVALGCDADLSPCARTETAQDGTPRVTLWVDCKDEQAAQLIAVRVTPKEPLSDAGTDSAADGGDAGGPAPELTEEAWRVQSPIEDGTDFFYVEYGVTPRGWDTLVAPHSLVSGQRYEVEFLASDVGSLSFDFKAP